MIVQLNIYQTAPLFGERKYVTFLVVNGTIQVRTLLFIALATIPCIFLLKFALGTRYCRLSTLLPPPPPFSLQRAPSEADTHDDRKKNVIPDLSNNVTKMIFEKTRQFIASNKKPVVWIGVVFRTGECEKLFKIKNGENTGS